MKNLAAVKNDHLPRTGVDAAQANVEDFRRKAVRDAEKATLLIQDAAMMEPVDLAALRRAELRVISVRDSLQCLATEIHELVTEAIAEGGRRALAGKKP